MRDHEGTQALLERLRHEEWACRGVDPDGTAYLDAVDRIEEARAAYRAQVAAEEHVELVIEERWATLAGIGAELL